MSAIEWNERPTAAIKTVLPPASVLTYTGNAYRVLPDRRFLLAFGEVHQLITGEKPQTVTLHFVKDAWQLDYGTQRVGFLPEIPAYRDAMQLLEIWSRLVRANAMKQVAITSVTALDEANTELSRFYLPHPLRALAILDQAVKKNPPSRNDPRTIKVAARALVYAFYQSNDGYEFGDVLAARTLATLAMARAQEPRALAAEDLLLCYRMRYEAEALAEAGWLPPNNPVRFFMQDGDALKKAAEQKGSDNLTQYLRAVNSQWHDYSLTDWYSWQQKTLKRPTMGMSHLNIASSNASFEHAVSMARAARAATVQELAGQEKPAGISLAPGSDFDGATQEFLATNDDLITDADPLIRFERVLRRRLSEARGPFLDRDAMRSFWEANFYSSLYEEASFGQHRLSSGPAVHAFADGFGKTEGPGQILQDSLRAIGNGLAGHLTGKKTPEHLARLRSAPPLVLSDIYFLGTRTISAYEPVHREGARILITRLDSRPAHRQSLSDLFLHISNVKLRQRWGLAAIDARPEFNLRWQTAFLAQIGEHERLLRISQNEDYHVEERLRALRLLGENQDTSRDLGPTLRKMFDQNPGGSILAYVGYLEQTGDYREIERAARLWLKDRKEKDLCYVAVVSRLARSLRHQGRADEALSVIEPVISSWKAEALGEGALTYLANGRYSEAVELAASLEKRYPDTGYPAAVISEVHWTRGDFKAAAEATKYDGRNTARDGAWLGAVPEVFARLFEKKTPAEMRQIAMTMISNNVGPWDMEAFAIALAERGKHESALAIMMALNEPSTIAAHLYFNDEASLKAYHDARAHLILTWWKGAQAANEWIKPRLSDNRLATARLFYEFSALEALWQVPDDRLAERDELYFILTMAAASKGIHDGPRVEKLKQHFAGKQNVDITVAGAKYLLGLIDEEALRPFEANALNRSWIIYFYALKAASEGRYEEAAKFIEGTIESAPAYSQPQRYAWGLSTKWAWAHKPFSRILEERLLVDSQRTRP